MLNLFLKNLNSILPSFIYTIPVLASTSSLFNSHKLNTKKINHKQLFNDLINYTSELTMTLFSLQKVNYLGLHAASAAR